MLVDRGRNLGKNEKSLKTMSVEWMTCVIHTTLTVLRDTPGPALWQRIGPRITSCRRKFWRCWYNRRWYGCSRRWRWCGCFLLLTFSYRFFVLLFLLPLLLPGGYDHACMGWRCNLLLSLRVHNICGCESQERNGTNEKSECEYS